METRAESARRLFTEGYNCAQSVAGAYADVLGIPLETVARMISGFGGGFGRLREVCGAVSGMTFVAGTLCGYGDPAAREEKTAAYAMIQTLANRFKEENGTIICRELLGLEKPEGTPVPEARTAAYYQKRPCAELCASAAGILEDWLRENAPEVL